MMESLSAYYTDDENPRDPDQLIWGKYTEEQWERMTVNERADAFWEYHDALQKSREAATL